MILKRILLPGLVGIFILASVSCDARDENGPGPEGAGLETQPAGADTGAYNYPAANNDVRGTMSGPGGAQAGVWVIAETRDLGTRYAKQDSRHQRAGSIPHSRPVRG